MKHAQLDPALPPELLNKQEAARFLRSSVRSLDEWRSTLQLGSVKLGGKVFFLKADLIRFIESRRVQPRKFKTRETPTSTGGC